MSNYQEKLQGISRGKKQKNTQSEEQKPDVAEILQLPDRKFKTIITNVLRTLMDKVDNMQEWAMLAQRWQS